MNIITLWESDINGIFLNKIFEDNDGCSPWSNRFCSERSLLSGIIKAVDTILKVQTLGAREETFWSKVQIRNNYSDDHGMSTNIHFHHDELGILQSPLESRKALV